MEGKLNTTEASTVYEALASVYPAFDEQIPNEMLEKGKAVVAVASFSLLPNSKRHGQFQQEGAFVFLFGGQQCNSMHTMRLT